MAQTNRQIVLDHLPQGKLTPATFRQTESAVPTPGEGEVLLRTLYVSLDAANRAWMQGATYRAALAAGTLDEGRWRNYDKLGRELAFVDRKEDRFAREAERKRWIAISKAQKAMRKKPDR